MFAIASLALFLGIFGIVFARPILCVIGVILLLLTLLAPWPEWRRE